MALKQANISSFLKIPHMEINVCTPRLIDYTIDGSVQKFRLFSSPFGYFATDSSFTKFLSVSQNEFLNDEYIKYLHFTESMEELLAYLWKYVLSKEAEKKPIRRKVQQNIKSIDE